MRFQRLPACALLIIKLCQGLETAALLAEALQDAVDGQAGGLEMDSTDVILLVVSELERALTARNLALVRRQPRSLPVGRLWRGPAPFKCIHGGCRVGHFA